MTDVKICYSIDRLVIQIFWSIIALSVGGWLLIANLPGDWNPFRFVGGALFVFGIVGNAHGIRNLRLKTPQLTLTEQGLSVSLQFARPPRFLAWSEIVYARLDRQLSNGVEQSATVVLTLDRSPLVQTVNVDVSGLELPSYEIFELIEQHCSRQRRQPGFESSLPPPDDDLT